MTSSNFLFSPADPSTSSKDKNHSNGSSQSSTAKSNPSCHHHQQVEPNTSITTCSSSSPSSSRDSNGNPFSFSCSSSSSQSLHSSISWQTDNTSFPNSNSPPPEDSSGSHHRPISQRDRQSAAAASNHIHSRPNSSSSGNHSINGNVGIDSNHQHHHQGEASSTSSASGPNLTFTHTFPRFNLSDHQQQQQQPSTVDVNRRNSHNPIHSIHHQNHNHNHRLSYDSAATAINQEQSSHSLLGYHHPASSSSYHPSFQYNHESLHHHPSSFDPYSNHQQYPNYHQSSYKAHPAPVPTATPTPPILPTPRPKVTTTLWEDEGTLCYQVDSKGVCVARRHDNNMINGTKLLNVVTSMTRGKRDTILKMEKSRVVVKSGSMHLKGVWIAFEKAKQLAEQNKIIDGLYPLFEEDISTFLYTPENYLRTSAVMAAAKKRNEVRDQEKAEMEKKASVRTAKTDLAKARKESLDGQISEITAPRSALAALEASRSQGQGQDYQLQHHYGGGTNLRPPVDLSQFRSHSYSGGGVSLNHSPREMGPPSISNASPVPTSQFSFHVPYSTERPRSANSSEHHSNSNSHSPSSEIPSTTNLQLSGLASRPIRQSSFDRRHSMPLRAGENEDNEVFSHSLPRFADAAFANAIRGSSNTSGGMTPSLSPLNIMSPSHPASPFGMVMNPNLYSSRTSSQHSQSQAQAQQLQYGDLSPEQQYKFQQQSKHQSYFPPHHQHTSSNSSSFPTNHHHHSSSSPSSSSRAASISSPGDYRNPSSHSSRSVSREHYLGNGQNQNHSLPGFSNNGWNSEYSHPITSSPISSQFPTTSSSSSGRSHSISHSSSNSNQNHRGSISGSIPPIHTQNNNIGSNSMDPSPTSSSGLKRSRASLTNDDSIGQQRFSLNMSTSNSTDSNGESQDLSSSSSNKNNNDLLELSQHSNFDTNHLDGRDERGQQRRDSNDDDDEIDREMKRSRSGGTGGNPLDDLANATAYLEG